MTNPSGLRRPILFVLLLLSLLMTGAACDAPVVTKLGEPAVVGGVEFAVPSYEVRYVEIAEDGQTYEYPRPVLAVELKMTNKGEDPLVYSPTHTSQQMSEVSTPLLYLDPGAEAELPPASKSPIQGVYLEKGRLESQVTQSKTLQPGETLTDVFLFEVPDSKEASLIFSIPPAMHRGQMPVLVRVPYTYEQPTGPKVYAVGQTIEHGDAKLTVQAPEVTYVKTTDTAQGEGYSSKPLLKIPFTLENAGEQSMIYEPTHRDLTGPPAVSLYSAKDAYKRVRFSATTTAEGQVTETKTLKPGEKVTDYVLFEQPPEGVDTLVMEFAARQYGGEGLIRVELPYEHTTPDKPKELAQGDKKGDDKDE